MKNFAILLFLLPLLLTAQQNSTAYASGIKSQLTNYRPGKFSVKPPSHKGISRSSDTLIVASNDTLIVTGAWQNNGPIYVLDSGVLIFLNAQATIMGDVVVGGYGQLWADNSTLNLPQQYFYQRAVITAQYGFINIYNSSFNFSGLSHSFAFTDSSTIILLKVLFTDWTTTGTYGQPTFIIDSTTLVGEIVITDSARITIAHSDTILLWHQIPRKGQLNWAFPTGDTLAAYSFNQTSTGVNGINYQIALSQCNTVWWAIMPVDSSDVTISNSNLRAIGAWFTGNDEGAVTGLNDNSTYPNSSDLFTDRYLQLINTHVTTWSLYPMDSSKLYALDCIVGEIGSQDEAQTVCDEIFVDGSGGYFWATGHAVQYGVSCAFTCNVRSEGNATEVVEYSSITVGAASGIDASILGLIQTTVTLPPVANDGSDVWVEDLNVPSVAYVNDTVAITGSAYILRGPSSLLMSFGHYSLQYHMNDTSAWHTIAVNSSPVNNDTLTIWNTTGVTPGTYTVVLTLYDNYGDIIVDTAAVQLLPRGLNGISAVSEQQVQLYPNPASGMVTLRLPDGEFNTIAITDMAGRIIMEQAISISTSNIELPVANLPAGMYILNIAGPRSRIEKKLVKE